MRFARADGTQRCARRGCSNIFKPHPKTPKGWQKFCSSRCKSAHWKRETNSKGGRTWLQCRLECPRGHQREPDNTYVDPTGRMHCKICRREDQKKWREANREYMREANRRFHHRHREELNFKRKLRKIRAA